MSLAETIYPVFRAFPDLLETVVAAVYTRFQVTSKSGIQHSQILYLPSRCS